MKSRLDNVKNWAELAEAANYSVKSLADQCDVSSRTLERFFSERIGMRPKDWLLQFRLGNGFRLIRSGHNVNEASLHLGFKDPSYFSKQFKVVHGVLPTDFKTLVNRALSEANVASLPMFFYRQSC